jgi:hypothetical protein
MTVIVECSEMQSGIRIGGQSHIDTKWYLLLDADRADAIVPRPVENQRE